MIAIDQLTDEHFERHASMCSSTNWAPMALLYSRLESLRPGRIRGQKNPTLDQILKSIR